jgi:hypothetical protein
MNRRPRLDKSMASRNGAALYMPRPMECSLYSPVRALPNMIKRWPGLLAVGAAAIVVAMPLSAQLRVGIGFRGTMGKEKLGSAPNREYMDSTLPIVRELGEIMEPGWQSGFTVFVRPEESKHYYLGVGYQWATFELRPEFMPAAASDSLENVLREWNTMALEVIVGGLIPISTANLYGEAGWIYRRFRSQNQLLWPITHPPKDARPYDEWRGSGAEVSIGILLPLIKAGHNLDLEAGVRAAQFGKDHIDLANKFPLPNVRTGIVKTLFLGLRWNA